MPYHVRKRLSAAVRSERNWFAVIVTLTLAMLAMSLVLVLAAPHPSEAARPCVTTSAPTCPEGSDG